MDAFKNINLIAPHKPLKFFFYSTSLKIIEINCISVFFPKKAFAF